MRTLYLLFAASALAPSAILGQDVSLPFVGGIPVDRVPALVRTGSGYDLFSGGFQRTVVDMSVPGALGKYGLSVTRSMNASSSLGNTKWVNSTFSNCFFTAGVTRQGQCYVRYPDGNWAFFTRRFGSGSLPSNVYSAVGIEDVLFVSTDQYSAPQKLVMTDGTVVRFESPLPSDPGAMTPTQPGSTWNTYYGSTSVTDPNGLVTVMDLRPRTSFVYYSGQSPGLPESKLPVLLKVTDPTGRSLSYNWDADGYLTSVDGSNGGVVSYVWDRGWVGPEAARYGKLVQVNYSDGTAATYTYTAVDGTGVFFETLSDVRSTAAMSQLKLTLGSERMFFYPSQYVIVGTPVVNNVVASEKTLDGAVAVTSRSVTFPAETWAPPSVFTETRGDGASRTVHYLVGEYVTPDTLSSLNPYSLKKPFISEETDYLGNRWAYTYDGISAVDNTFLRKTIRDPLGRVTTYVRNNPYKKVTQVLRPDGSIASWSYLLLNDGYYVSSVTDERGNVTSYNRNSNGTISQINYADGSTEAWTYNGFSQPLTHRLRNGNTESFNYDGTGLVSKHLLPTAPDAIDYTYYPAGHPWQDRLRTVTDGRGNITTYDYDLAFVNGVQGTVPCFGRGLVTKIINPDGTYKSFGYDVYGAKVWEENELRQRSTYVYDVYGRITSVTDPLGRTAQYQYQHSGFSENALAHTLNKPRVIISPTGRRKGMLYDANFRLITEVVGESSVDSSSTAFEYDAVGNLSKLTDPAGRVTTYAYDNRNRRITEFPPLGRTTDFSYDAVGNLLWIHYPDGTGISKEYDNMNRVSTSTDEMLRTTTYLYHPSGKVRQIIDPKNNGYRCDYDASDRQTILWFTNPSQTGWDYEQSIYDGAGNLTGFRNRSGHWKTVQYDNRNREIAMSWNDGITPGTNTVYDAIGRIIQRANATSTVNYSYDAAGQVTGETQAITGSTAQTFTYEYDGDGNRTRLKKD